MSCRSYSLIVVTLLSLALCSASVAAPSLSGPTGLIRIPTAYTLDRGEFDLGVDFRSLDRAGTLPTIDIQNYRFVTGVHRHGNKGLEVGYQHLALDQGLGEGDFLFAKYRFKGLLPLGTVAVGGNASVSGPSRNFVYVVGSTNAAHTFAVHYGLGANLNDARGVLTHFGGKDSMGKTDRIFAFFGAEVDLGNFKLNVDFNGDGVGYGLNYFASDMIVVNLFHLDEGDAERALSARHRLGGGITLQF